MVALLLVLLLAMPAFAGEVCFKIPAAGEAQSTACLVEYRNTYGVQLDESALAQLLYERACKTAIVQDAADTKMAEASDPTKWETCGDGAQTVREECDDGNATNGDGCDSNCSPTGCGNGIKTTGEACDDGNNIDTDLCTAGCVAAACGDGILCSDPACNTGPGLPLIGGPEECDDGNKIDGDGCQGNCSLPKP